MVHVTNVDVRRLLSASEMFQFAPFSLLSLSGRQDGREGGSMGALKEATVTATPSRSPFAPLLSALRYELNRWILIPW